MINRKSIISLAAAGLLAVGAIGCDSSDTDRPLERAGDKVEKAGDKVQDAAKDAQHDIDKAADKAKDKMEDAKDKAKDAVNNP